MRLVIALLICAFVASIYFWVPYPWPVLALVLAVAAIAIELLYTGPTRVIRREIEIKALTRDIILVLYETRDRIASKEPRVMSPKLSELQEMIRDRRYADALKSGAAANKNAYLPNTRLLREIVGTLQTTGHITMQKQGYKENERYSLNKSGSFIWAPE